jgi:hypothetical protein
MERVSDSWADSRPKQGAEFQGTCHYCEEPIYSDDETTWEELYGITHLACQDEYIYDMQDLHNIDMRDKL